MPKETVLQAEHLCLKKKDGLVLDDICLAAEEGSFFGLVGDRGAGKTAFLHLAAGLDRPTSGTITICGLNTQDRQFRRRRGRLLGCMPQTNGRYPGLTVLDYMELYAHAAGLTGLSGRNRCVEVLSYVSMERRVDQLFDELGTGEKRLACLARTIIHQPPLLLLDEPFSGTERGQRLTMEELLSGLIAGGTTIVMSTEDFSCAANLCSHIGSLKGGVLSAQGSVEEVIGKTRSEMPVHIRVLGNADRAAAVLRRIPEVKTVSLAGNHLLIRFPGDEAAEARLLNTLTDEGVQVHAFYREVQDTGEG